MARLATLAVLLLSLLAVASCRVLEAESAISDDQGPPNPVLLAQDDDQAYAAAAAAEVTPTVAGGEAVMLRLPSHRRPCRLHRHLWWARHRGAFSGPGEAPVRPAVVPTELARGEEQEPREAELVAVAEPDPDSRPDTDGEQKPFHGEEEEGDDAKAWKMEMLRRFRHGIRFHHRHHHEHDGEEHDDQEEQVKDEGADMKLPGRFHHRHHLRHHHEREEQEDKNEGINMKLFGRFHHHRHHAHDGDGEADEVEELARRLSEAIMRRRAGHGGHHHHHHHHGAPEGGVKKWFKGLMNRF